MKLMGLFALVLTTLWLVTGCEGSGPEEEEAAQQQGPVVGEFLGEIQQADAFLALVAERPQEEGYEEREVRGYLCDGKQLAEWFVGMISGDEVQLASENGVQIDTTLAPDGAFGTITLSDDQSFEFEAVLSSGVEGLYLIEVPSGEGPLSATSWRGAQLEGIKTYAEIAGNITPPKEGKPVDFKISVPTIEEGENHWVVLAEEGQQVVRIKGAQRGAQEISGFISTQSNPFG
jgi:hypothetical protein